MTKIAVIIVNYKTAALVEAHLPAISADLKNYPDAHVYIVENASPADDAKRLATAIAAQGLSGRATLLIENRNGGFASGNNAALMRIDETAPDTDYVLFLNPDAYPRPGAIPALIEALRDNPDTAAVGGALEVESGEMRHSKFDFPNPLQEFVSEAGFGHRYGRLVQARLAARAGLEETEWVSGAAVAFRRAAMKEAGYLDDGYFLYFEETDYMLALRRRGWRIFYAPSARFVHIGGAATGLTHGESHPPRLPPYWFQSWRRYYGKNYGPMVRSIAALAKAAGIVCGETIRLFRGRPPSKPEHYLGDVVRYCLLAQEPRVRT